MFHVEHHDFDQLLRRNGLEVPSDRWCLLKEYVEALLEWNKRINLISRRDEENIWTAHIIHSIAPLQFPVDSEKGLPSA